jgi:hypothetical protein
MGRERKCVNREATLVAPFPPALIVDAVPFTAPFSPNLFSCQNLGHCGRNGTRTPFRNPRRTIPLALLRGRNRASSGRYKVWRQAREGKIYSSGGAVEHIWESWPGFGDRLLIFFYSSNRVRDRLGAV